MQAYCGCIKFGECLQKEKLPAKVTAIHVDFGFADLDLELELLEGLEILLGPQLILEKMGAFL
jgi:hypothetical protein